MTPAPHADLRAVPPRDLSRARLAAHYAAQPAAAAAYALLEAPPDHSHSNLLWSAKRRALLGRELPRGGRCFVDVAQLRTGLVAPDGTTVALDLAGATLGQAFDGLAGLLREVGEEVPKEGLRLPAYDLPDSPIAQGGRFEAPAEELGVLGQWFELGAQALGRVSREQLGESEVRGWPHHFDLAALLTLDPELEAEEARSVNVGLSPGDGSYPEPYFYVSPWPYPEPAALPALEGGARWHTDGFTAAVLTGTDLLEAGGPEGLPGTLATVVAGTLELLRG